MSDRTPPSEPLWAVVCDQDFYPWIKYYNSEDEARAAMSTETPLDEQIFLLVQIRARKSEEETNGTT